MKKDEKTKKNKLMSGARGKSVGNRGTPARKKAGVKKKESLEDKVNFLQTLVDTIPSPIFYKDTNGVYLGCNHAFEKVLGLPKDEIIGKTVYDIAAKELADKYLEMDEALFKKPGVQIYETSVRFADGVTREVIFNKATYTRSDKTLAGLVGIMTDITEHRKFEDALSRSEERYRTLFEESLDGVFVSTPDGKIIELNPAGLKALGYSTVDELKNINMARDVYDSPADRERFVREIEEKGLVQDLEIVARKKDGKRIFLSISASAVRDKEGRITAYRGILRDITVHKSLEQQLIQAQKMEAIGKLTGGIAHDFNNMIMAIVGYTTLLKMKLKEDDPLVPNVRHILGVTERAANLTKRLLAFGRKQIISLKEEDLNVIVERVEDLLSRLIGEHIEFRTTLMRDDLTVMADSGQIEQVLMNLATNARDAMPKGGLLSIRTDSFDLDSDFARLHGYGEPGRYARITVEDTGMGMDRETVGKIFDPFFTTKDIGKGTGLGLSIVYGIIKQHNGYINVYSEPGIGTCFKIYLPAVKSKAKEKEEAVHRPHVFMTGKETILVTEDDAEVRRITKTVLEDSGYTVIEASDGEEALHRFNADKDRIKLLVLDVIMPRKNGREVYEEILKISPGMKAIFLSGYNEEIIHKKGIIEKGFNFIQKPISPTDFLMRVREALNG